MHERSGTRNTCLAFLLTSCSVLLSLLAGSLDPKFHFKNQRKKLVRSSGNGQTYYSLADGVTALSQLYALYSDRARSFNQ